MALRPNAEVDPTFVIVSPYQGTAATDVAFATEGFSEMSATAGTAVYATGVRPGAPAGQTTHGVFTGRKIMRYHKDDPGEPLLAEGIGVAAMWVRFPAAPASTATHFMGFQTSSDAHQAYALMNTAGKLRLTGVSDADESDLTANTYHDNQWYALLYTVDNTEGTQTLRIYDDAGVFLEEITGDCGTTEIVEFEVGVIVSGSSTWAVHFDDCQLADGAVFLDLPPSFGFVMCPGISSSSATLTSYTDNAAEVRFVIERVSDDQQITVTNSERPESNGAKIHSATGLEPFTEYRYLLEAKGETGDWVRYDDVDDQVGRFQTLPSRFHEGDLDFRLAMLGCNRTTNGSDGDDSPLVYDEILALGSDLLGVLHSGDLHYGEVEANKTKNHFDKIVQQITLHAPLAKVLRRYWCVYNRDDHDGGGIPGNNGNNSGVGETSSKASILAKRKLFGTQMNPYEDDGADPSVIDIGPVTVLQPDLRNVYHTTHEDAFIASAETLLGAVQESWLLERIGTSRFCFLNLTMLWGDADTVDGQLLSSKIDAFPTHHQSRARIAAALAGVPHAIGTGDAHALSLILPAENAGFGGGPVFGASGAKVTSNWRGGPYDLDATTYRADAGTGYYYPDIDTPGDPDVSVWGELRFSLVGSDLTVRFIGHDAILATDVLDYSQTWAISLEPPTSEPTFLIDGHDFHDPRGSFFIGFGTQLSVLPGKRSSLTEYSRLRGASTGNPVTTETLRFTQTLWITDRDALGVEGGALRGFYNKRAALGLLGFEDYRVLTWAPLGPDGPTFEGRAQCFPSAVCEQVGNWWRLPIVWEIPSALWRSPDLSVWFRRMEHNFDGAKVDNMDGSNAPVNDAIIRVHGPINEFEITDDRSGTWVKWTGVLTVDQYLIIDCGTQDAYVVDEDTWDVTGIDTVNATLDFGEGSQLVLTPYPYDGDLNDWKATITSATTGRATGTAIEINLKTGSLV